MSWLSGGVATKQFAPAGGIVHHEETRIAIGRGHQELMVIAADIGALVDGQIKPAAAQPFGP